MTDPDDRDAGPRSSARSSGGSAGETRSEWDHLLDPRFWGLDADSLRRWGMGVGEDTGAAGAAALHDRLAAIEASLIAMNQRIAVLERLATDDEAALAAEIEKLREEKGAER